jgi:plasmid stabilization system protein ParE
MSSQHKLIVSEEAGYHREELIIGIAYRHSFQLAVKVNSRIKEVLDNLPNFPNKWPKVQSRSYGEIRKATVDDLTIILYRITDDEIRVLDITDARSDWK